MALRIFDTDPDAKPKARFVDDTVGRIHSGKSVDNVPVALEAWRFSTGDPEVAAALGQLFGGTPEELETDKENFISVETPAKTIQVVLDGPGAYYSDMKLWNRNKLVHHCDGVEFLSPEEKKGLPCGCPHLFAERKQAAKDYVGPNPAISITFRLAEDYDLGLFKFQTGSWTLAEREGELIDALAKFGGEVLAELTIEEVSYTTKKGRNVHYFKPVVKVIKPWADAIADAPF